MEFKERRVEAVDPTVDERDKKRDPVDSSAVSPSLDRLILQAKLTVGPAHDPLEHEADMMAARVVRILRTSATLAENAAPEATTPRIQRAVNLSPAAMGGDLDQDTERVVRSESRGGSKLPDDSRSKMEAAFGADFSRVRVHAGPLAAELNDKVQAKAFTTGNNIFFRDGLPDTSSAGGQGLLAHELTHTIQQGGAAIRTAQRKIAQSTVDGTGPKAEIADAALGGDVATRSADTVKLVKAGTAKADHPWAKARTKANNDVEPNSVKKMKWAYPHTNREGHLPGVAGAGGFTEYYINNGPKASGNPTDAERLVVQNSTKDAFHTATHYGRDGDPPFTHLGKL